MPILIEYYID